MSRPQYATHAHLDPTSPVAFDLWLRRAVDALTNAVSEPMPPIRCTVAPACGHCWYCTTAVAK